MLKVENLSKSFSDLTIWTNLTATFLPGEIVSIQGKSGEGKTTFLRCINELEPIDSGNILIDDKYLCRTENGTLRYCDEEQKKEFHNQIGMVFQGFNLFPHLTILENLTLAANYHKIDTEKNNKTSAASWLDRMDLSDKKDSYPHRISGGQQQRVAIARACMLNPRILCFDEPTSALDEETGKQVEKIMKELAGNNMTILIVTHDRNFATRVSNRILHIEDGVFREEIIN